MKNRKAIRVTMSEARQIKMRRKSPVMVQQWVDSLPNITKPIAKVDSPMLMSPARHNLRGLFLRDASIQSDDTSNCSSVESVLELRKPDPEAVLLGLGFGPPKSTDYLSRIPQRFLQPSKVNGIDVQKFLQDHGSVDMTNFSNCSQIHPLPVSPIRSCDSTKKNSL